ncbi:MAG: hypothetical protein BWY19_00012 [bacterium ADurb.Bin212]|nr:MAG: hypothetical protein BWY19_00012 [bacterium ADurb.Bin212]
MATNRTPPEDDQDTSKEEDQAAESPVVTAPRRGLVIVDLSHAQACAYARGQD